MWCSGGRSAAANAVLAGAVLKDARAIERITDWVNERARCRTT